MSRESFSICSYNIHKGFSQLNRRMAIHELREQLGELDPDIALLQEVQGQHQQNAKRHANWPAEPQHEFLASGVLYAAYGRNAVYANGHHGNAILSRFPILAASNQDVSLYRLEQRGILHCELALPNELHVHCLCVHLSLTEYQRRRQIEILVDYVGQYVPPHAPLIIGGDFNDWRRRVNGSILQELGMIEAFTAIHGHPARSYPSNLPLLSLDRIYLRGLEVESAELFWGSSWSQVSDHALLYTRVRLT